MNFDGGEGGFRTEETRRAREMVCWARVMIAIDDDGGGKRRERERVFRKRSDFVLVARGGGWEGLKRRDRWLAMLVCVCDGTRRRVRGRAGGGKILDD